jgi:hypothetical protein
VRGEGQKAKGKRQGEIDKRLSKRQEPRGKWRGGGDEGREDKALRPVPRLLGKSKSKRQERISKTQEARGVEISNTVELNENA